MPRLTTDTKPNLCPDQQTVEISRYVNHDVACMRVPARNNQVFLSPGEMRALSALLLEAADEIDRRRE